MSRAPKELGHNTSREARSLPFPSKNAEKVLGTQRVSQQIRLSISGSLQTSHVRQQKIGRVTFFSVKIGKGVKKSISLSCEIWSISRSGAAEHWHREIMGQRQGNH